MEQVALVIRFFDQLSQIQESFLGFFPSNEGLSRKAVAKQIVNAVTVKAMIVPKIWQGK